MDPLSLTAEEYGLIADAYKVLSDKDRRLEYDQLEGAKQGQILIGRRYKIPFTLLLMYTSLSNLVSHLE